MNHDQYVDNKEQHYSINLVLYESDFICENLHRVFVENWSCVFGEILQRVFGELEIWKSTGKGFNPLQKS